MDMTVSFAVTITFHQLGRQFLCHFKYHKKVGAHLEPKNMRVVKPSLMDMVDNNIIS